MGDLLGSPRVASPTFAFLTFRLSWASALRRGCSLFIHGRVAQHDIRVNDVGCPKKPTGHGIAKSLTRDAVLFQSRARGHNFEVEAYICGLPDLQLHARRSNSSSVASAICPTSPYGVRLQLTRQAPQQIGTDGSTGLPVAQGRVGEDMA
ncbi:hypothetical protein L3X38_011924 [Prunus dulcis]|uniref:Uncharacterized protein n=1 Tax=Prunus dulcis TaxID=3755 RepID=A0AAD4ZER8_PRUDU|nr:hypothetical protein L3X38_011924 [Prunus dulcis]